MKRILFVIASIALLLPNTPTSAHLNAPMLVISRISLDLPVGEIPLVKTIWDTTNLGRGIAHLGTTGYTAPGDNDVIAGHLTLTNGAPGAFYRLSWLTVGDWIWLEQGDTVFTYEITAIFTVDPRAVWVTYAVPGETLLTLITCSGDLIAGYYDKRLIVQAVEVAQ